jgi:hypothetical protein
MSPNQLLATCFLAVLLMVAQGLAPVSATGEPTGGPALFAQPSGDPDQPGGHEEPGAGGPRGQGGLTPNCRAEIKQLCQGVEPGGGRIRKCMKENEGNLSPGCRQQIEEHRGRAKQRVQEMKAACEGDVKRFCPNMEPGSGLIGGCLKEHSKELSEGCARVMEKRRHRGESEIKQREPSQTQ